MKRTSKNPAPKSKKPAPKPQGATKESAPKDAAAPKTAPSTKPRDSRLPAPGATLDREYKGKTYHLKFLDEGGVEVAGKLFGSLSAAARHITGAASINGFLWRPLRSVESSLMGYAGWFNAHRPHQGLEQRTPDEVFTGRSTRATWVPLRPMVAARAFGGDRELPVLCMRSAA